jgi:hypothetical protein
MSAISKQALVVDNSQSFPNNNAGAITPTALRNFNTNMIDSNVNQTEYNTNSGSWNVSISNLNTFTASQQPSFNALNSFTASQLTINTGVNQFTQSANASINRLDTFSSSFNAYTASINQIQSNGVVLGNSTRFNLVGPGTFFSASLVQNVGGTIATLTFTSDNAKLNTSSFNDYTASTAATQSVFSASVATSFSSSNATFTAFSASQNSFNLSATASIVELLNLSSSLSGGYATQGELDQSASVLQANINQKLFTSSFNDYTQSTNNTIATLTTTASFNSYTASTNVRLNNLEITSASLLIETANLESFSASTITRLNELSSFTASYATTGSNTFTGNQILNNSLTITGSTTITGSLVITGSAYGNIVSMSVVSNTASMNLSISNFFTLGLTSGQNTRIEPTNILPGETINLLISQPSIGSGSVSYPSTFKFASGLPYSASLNSASVDIMTFITFDTGSIYAASIKNLR